MIKYNSGTFSFHKYTATFTDNGEQRSVYTSDKQYYEDMVARWGRLENLVFSTITASQEQMDRLDWLNTQIENNAVQEGASLYQSSCDNYITHGIVLPGEEFSTLSSIADNVDVKARTLEYFRNIKRDEARQRRWEEETGGIVVNNLPLRTDGQSQNRVSQLVTTVQADPAADNFDFEAQPGNWIVVSRDEAIVIGKAVSQHVQSCFTNCKNLHEQVNSALTIEEINNIDISIGWPT